MRSPSHLYRRNGVFYFRWTLPPACHARLAPCPADVRLSLGTYRRLVALPRAAAMWLRALAVAERILAGVASISYNDLCEELRGPLQVSTVAEADTAQTLPVKVTLASLLGPSLKGLQEAVGVLYGAAAPLTMPVRCAADIYLEVEENDQQISLRHYDRVPNFTAEIVLDSAHVAEILSAQSYKFQIKQFRWHPGPASNTPQAGAHLIVPDEPIQCMLLDVTTTAEAADRWLVGTFLRPTSTKLSLPNPPPQQPLFQTTLSKGLEEWVMANADWALASRDAATSAVRHLIQVVGDKNPAQVTPGELINFKDLHDKLPPDYFSRPKKYDGKTAQQVATDTKKSELETFSRTTIKNKLDWLNRYFFYLESKGYIVKNVAGGLAPSKAANARDARDPFSDEDIHKIFGPSGVELISKYISREKKQIAIWGPLIGLFTGARAQEIALLTVENICTHSDGTQSISITDENSNKAGATSLKTQASKRKIPIHPTLAELGFLSFVNRRRKHGSNALLFPEVEKYAAVNKRHTAMTKWFNDVLLKKIGVKTKRKSFHSLRHSVIQKFFEDSTLAYKAHQFTGHDLHLPLGTKRSTQVNTYGRAFEPAELVELLPLLDYKMDWSSVKGLTKSLGYSA